MARYTGPATRKSRRLGVDLVGGDQSFEKRPYPPGQHGRARVKESEYRTTLRPDDEPGLVLARLPAGDRSQVEGEVLAAYDASLRVLENLGAKLVDVNLPRSFTACPCWAAAFSI